MAHGGWEVRGDPFASSFPESFLCAILAGLNDADTSKECVEVSRREPSIVERSEYTEERMDRKDLGASQEKKETARLKKEITRLRSKSELVRRRSRNPTSQINLSGESYRRPLGSMHLLA